MNQPKFWIGCFQQPKESFQKFKNEGFNLVVQPCESFGDTPVQRRKAASDLGMYYIDCPTSLADVEAMIQDPFCYALGLPDEPSEHMPWYSSPGAQEFVAQFVAQWKPLFDAVKGRKPIWANFGGNRITSGRPTYAGQMLLPFTQACHVNEVCFDTYPINASGAIAPYTSQNYNGGIDPLIVVGENDLQFTCRVLQSFCPGMGTWAYLETTKIAPENKRAPTGAEIQAEADSLLKLGVKGFVFFTHSFGNGQGWDASAPAGLSMFDGRNADQVAGCKAIIQKVFGSGDDLGKRVDALEARLATLEGKRIPRGVEFIF